MLTWGAAPGEDGSDDERKLSGDHDLPSSPPRKRAKGIDLKLTAISDRRASQRAPIDALTPLKRSSCQMPYQANRASA
jgi:hypothetical protein